MSTTSKYRSHSHRFTQQIIVSENDFDRFYKCGQQHVFASKLITIHGISFQLDLYPNFNNNGYVGLYLTCTQLPKDIKSIVLFCKLYCEPLSILYKTSKIFKRSHEWISWGSIQLKLSECKHHNTKQLEFGCDIELLQSKMIESDKTNSVKSNVLFYDDQKYFNRFIISSTKTEWNINTNTVRLFKYSRNGQIYYSNDINHIWCIRCCPNWKTKNTVNGQLILALELLRLPPRIKALEIKFELKSIQQNVHPTYKPKESVIFAYNKRIQQWPAKLFQHSSLKDMKSLTFTVYIEIINIFEFVKGNDSKMRKIKKSRWKDFNFKVTNNNNISYVHRLHDIDNGNAMNIMRDEPQLSLHDQQQQQQQEEKEPYHLRVKMGRQSTRYNSIDSISSDEASTPRKKGKTKYKRRSKANKIRSRSVSSSSTPDSPTTAQSITSDTHLSPKLHAVNISQSKTTVVSTNVARYENGSSGSDLLYSIANVKKQLSDLADEMACNQLSDMDNSRDDEKYNNDEPPRVTKFKRWWKQSVQLTQYLRLFEEKHHADVAKIKYFDDKLLETIGIDDVYDRKFILEEADRFNKSRKAFDKKLQKNQILSECAQRFRDNGILRMEDLRLDVKNKRDLSRILGLLPNDEKLIEIFGIIHPSKAKLQSKMNDLQHKYSTASTSLDLLYKGIASMQSIIETVHPISNDLSIKQQYQKLFHDSESLLSKHQRLLTKTQRQSRHNAMQTHSTTSSLSVSRQNLLKPLSGPEPIKWVRSNDTNTNSNMTMQKMQSVTHIINKLAKEQPKEFNALYDIILRETDCSSFSRYSSRTTTNSKGSSTINTSSTITTSESQKMDHFSFDHQSAKQQEQFMKITLLEHENENENDDENDDENHVEEEEKKYIDHDNNNNNNHDGDNNEGNKHLLNNKMENIESNINNESINQIIKQKNNEMNESPIQDNSDTIV